MCIIYAILLHFVRFHTFWWHSCDHHTNKILKYDVLPKHNTLRIAHCPPCLEACKHSEQTALLDIWTREMWKASPTQFAQPYQITWLAVSILGLSKVHSIALYGCTISLAVAWNSLWTGVVYPLRTDDKENQQIYWRHVSCYKIFARLFLLQIGFVDIWCVHIPTNMIYKYVR